MKQIKWIGALALLIATAAPLKAQGPLPAGEGRDLVAVACTQCHALAPIVAGREGPRAGSATSTIWCCAARN